MHKQYGLKRSPALRFCKALAFFLFLTFFVSFTLIFFDTDLLTGMSDEKKEDLVSSRSFQTAVRLADEISKNSGDYGKVENIKAINYLASTSRDFLGMPHKEVYLRVIRKNGDDLYFRFLRGFEVTDAKAYTKALINDTAYNSTSEEIFKGAEIKYLKELLKQDGIEKLLYQFKKEEVTSKRYWNILLKIKMIYSVTENYRNISSVYVGSVYDDDSRTQNAVIKITFEDANILYYTVSGKNVIETDSYTYYARSKYEEYFDNYDLEILFKEAGYVWQ